MAAQEGVEQHGCTGDAPGWARQEQSNNCPETRRDRAVGQCAERGLRGLDTEHTSEKQLPHSRGSTSAAGGGSTLCSHAVPVGTGTP